MPDKITVHPPEMTSFEFTDETVSRLIKSGIVRQYTTGKCHYTRDEFAAELLEYLDGEINSFATMEAQSRVLAFENGLFRNVAIVRTIDGGLKFCPASKYEDTDAWTIHDGYASENLADMGFEDISKAIVHAESIGWNVVIVQE